MQRIITYKNWTSRNAKKFYAKFPKILELGYAAEEGYAIWCYDLSVLLNHKSIFMTPKLEGLKTLSEEIYDNFSKCLPYQK